MDGQEGGGCAVLAVGCELRCQRSVIFVSGMLALDPLPLRVEVMIGAYIRQLIG